MKTLVSKIALLSLIVLIGLLMLKNFDQFLTTQKATFMQELKAEREILMAKIREQQPAVIAQQQLEIDKLNSKLYSYESQVKTLSQQLDLKQKEFTALKTYAANLENAPSENVCTSEDRNIASVRKMTRPTMNGVNNKNLVQIYGGYGRTSTKITETPSSFEQTDQKGFLFGAGYSREIFSNTNLGVSIFSNKDVYINTGWGF